MAKKFDRIRVHRLAPAAYNHPEVQRLAEDFNQRLDVLVTEANDILQQSTGTLADLPLWCRGQLIELYPEDWTDQNTDYKVRHNLGVIPRYWIVVAVTPRADPGGWPSGLYLCKSATGWTDSHVFFRINGMRSGTDFAFRITILLLP